LPLKPGADPEIWIRVTRFGEGQARGVWADLKVGAGPRRGAVYRVVFLWMGSRPPPHMQTERRGVAL